MYRSIISGIVLTSVTTLSHAVGSINFLTPVASGGQASQTTNSTRLETDNKLYQAVYNISAFSGDLKEFVIQASGATVSVSASASTAVSSMPVASDRTLISVGNSNTGIDFTSAAVSSTDYWANTASGAMSSGPLDLAQLIDYLAGESISSSASIRSRTTPLGDIINSAPQFAGNFNFGYEVLTMASVSGSTASLPSPGDKYATYIRTGASATRDAMIYVGANDGALHGFNADDVLKEVFAYYPQTTWQGLAALPSPSYSHQYFVDGSARLADAYDPSTESWKTLLVGTTGAGGSGVFALDITNPVELLSTSSGTFAADTVLWEVNDTVADYADLGYTLPQATLALLENGQWAALVANGYGSDNGEAVLYVIDLFSGAKIREFNLGGTNNGLSTPVAVDLDGDMAVDLVYAGDLQGNLWRFNLSGSDEIAWSYSTLFQATDGSLPQPITAKPQVVRHSDGQVVVFGTGKYFESGDEDLISAATSGLVPEPAYNSFYGIQDRNGGTTVAANKVILQTLNYEGELDGTRPCSGNAPCVRVTSTNTLGTADRGWRINFVPTAGRSNALYLERIVAEPVVRNNRVIFTTLIPDGDPYSGTGWIMELSAVDGKRLDQLPFDLDQNGSFDANDQMADNAATQADGVEGAIISGVQSTVGLISTPNVVAAASKEFKFNSGSSAQIQVTVESGGGQNLKGRSSWQQLK